MYFIFKGIKSTEMGVTVLTQPPIKSPESRTWDSFIDNKDGADSLFLGYKPLELSMEIAVEGKENLDKVLGWLDGEGQLIRSDFPDRYRNVHIIEGIELNMIHPELWQGSFTYLVVDPYWYKVGDEWTEVKPNLIPNGWDSFEPYGNEGKETKAPLEVFDEDYKKNIFSKVLYGDINYYDGVMTYRYKKIKTQGKKFRINVRLKDGADKAEGFYMSLGNHPNPNGNKAAIFISNGSFTSSRRFDLSEEDDVYISYYPLDADLSIIENYDISIQEELTGWGADDYTLAWEDIPEEDKPVRAWDNMAVHFTPLGNGLTRIQTWGGNHVIKLRTSVKGDFNKGVTQNRSLYLENNGEHIVRFNQDGGTFDDNPRAEWGSGEHGYKDFTGVFSDDRSSANVYIRVYGDTADFIASDPQIVEGKASYPPYPIERDIVIGKIGTIESSIGEGFKIVKLNKDVHSGEIKVTTTMIPSVHTDNILVSYWYDSNLIKEEVVKVTGEGKVRSKHTIVEGEPVNRVYLYKDTTFESSKSKEAIYLETKIAVSYKEFPEVNGYVENEGNTKSYPTLHLKNNSKDTNVVRLNINDSIIRYEFPQGETEVFINLMGMRAGTEPTHTGYYRHDVRDKYLYVERDKGMHLNPGPNTITSDGDVEIKLLRKDRWI